MFQPAEENGGGGREMIKAGLMEEKPDACFALHVKKRGQRPHLLKAEVPVFLFGWLYADDPWPGSPPPCRRKAWMPFTLRRQWCPPFMGSRPETFRPWPRPR